MYNHHLYSGYETVILGLLQGFELFERTKRNYNSVTWIKINYT